MSEVTPVPRARIGRFGGIYQISGPTERVYIGSSENIPGRWNDHRAQLRSGRHHNPRLQADWTEYGGQAFQFTLLEEVADVALLIAAEQAHLDAAVARGLPVYNVSLDVQNPARGLVHTEESRRKMSASVKAAQTPEVLAGKRERATGSLNPGSKLDEASVLRICERLIAGEHPVALAAEYCLTEGMIYQIRRGAFWKDLVPPEAVAAMMAVTQNPWESGLRTVTDEHRQRFSEVGKANKGRPASEKNKAMTSERSRGAGNPKAKLTEDLVAQVKGLLARGALCKDLAVAFGITPNGVSRIKTGETWGHVEAADVRPEYEYLLALPKRAAATPEHRANLSAALTGKPKSEEHRANLWRGREVTPEFREQMAANGRMLKGKPKSARTRARMSQAHRGAGNAHATLDDERVLQIKVRLAAGESGRTLAREFDVSEPTVSNIKSGKTWAHVVVPGQEPLIA